jgi:hypothetical protein
LSKPTPGEGPVGGGKPLPAVTPQKELRGPTPNQEKAIAPAPKLTSPNEGPAGGGKPPSELKPLKELRSPAPGPKEGVTPESKPAPPPVHVAQPPGKTERPACGKPGEPACPK